MSISEPKIVIGDREHLWILLSEALQLEHMIMLQYLFDRKLLPAARSLALSALPIGLAHGVKLARDVAAGQMLTWADVEALESDAARVRREMEQRMP